MIKMIMTPSEIFFATRFAESIANGNIDNRDFMDNHNRIRTDNKVKEDNIKGKLSEIHVCNVLGDLGIVSTMDFDIYEKGVGDSDFDIVMLNGKTIDVKASSPYAKCLMVEVSKLKAWRKQRKVPTYLCMVSVLADRSIGYKTEYMFGCPFKYFLKLGKLYRRGECIPNTKIPLKTDNIIITKDQCRSYLSLKELVA